MKKFFMLMVLFAVGFVFVAPSVVADPGLQSPRLDQRERNQEKRINEGVSNGSLTKEEAQALRKEQEKIRNKKQKMKKDGKLTNEERKELNRDLNVSSKSIYKEKHDAEKR